jgi:alcohol dehydrogenase (cytochrome c)
MVQPALQREDIRMSHPYRSALALALSLLAPLALAQSLSDLKRDASTTGDVTTYGMGWGQQRYSAMTQLNKGNVKRLVPAWNLSLDNSANASTQPLFIGGVMYVATHNATLAIDPETGRQKWKVPIDLPADVNGYLCCGIQSRGMAALDGVLYRTTIDAHVMAIDMASGKTLWKKKAADYKQGYSMTHAPLVAGGVLITGISGGEYGTRGFLDGWDLKTGEKKWRTWTTVAPGEKGGETWNPDRYEKGGAPTWLTGTYDPDLNLVYWGTGNGGPWNPAWRGKDALYICSILALDPATGKIVWYYQVSPGDPYDYDATNELVLAELPVDGAPRKVLMQANRNGFFYVLDRTNGKLLSANAFSKKINWATGIDPKTGRPIDTEMTQMVRTTVKTAELEVWPSAMGGKNWMPMSFDPVKMLVYMNTLNLGMKVTYNQPAYKQGAWYLGLDLGGFFGPESSARGSLTAWDPVAGKALWEAPTATPFWAGVLSTAGGLVFTGAQTGEFLAFDADTGVKLWQFQTGSGITGLPITWEYKGQQYVTVTSGAASLYGAFGNDPNLQQVPAGSSVWTFRLSD